MAGYETKVMNNLLDSYERSLLSQGKNKVAVHISFPFTRKNLPEYFNESSLAYEEIHGSMKALEEKGLVKIVWRNGKKDHIIEKVLLREEQVEAAYAYMKRSPRSDSVQEQRLLLEEAKAKYETPVLQAFLAYIEKRLEEGRSVKEFLDITDPGRTRKILKAVGELEKNREGCYIREFSIRHFGDSKTFQSLLGIVGKIMRRFSEGWEDMELSGILAEYLVYQTPDYVYIKGEGRIAFDKDPGCLVDLACLEQGIGLSGEDIGKVRIMGKAGTRKVLTIENLTTFFSWKEENCLMVYLGGYHNSVRRKLLEILYRELPDAEYLHFGDIDVGGFEIYRDLCRKTGIPFKTYHMGIEELERYRRFTQPLTDNDRKRLELLLEKAKKNGEDTRVLQHMKETGRKLEQEAVGALADQVPEEIRGQVADLS